MSQFELDVRHRGLQRGGSGKLQVGPAERRSSRVPGNLAGSARPDEIVNAIFELRPSFPLTELAELLDRAKDFQVQAEALQHKAATLMDVVDQIANSVRYDRGC
jgi:hypothetical protein